MYLKIGLDMQEIQTNSLITQCIVMILKIGDEDFIRQTISDICYTQSFFKKLL
jgi:hypothetical protein